MEKEKIPSKQNRGAIGALCVLLIILLIAGTGGLTYARYMSQEKGTGSAQIANWAFQIDKGGEEVKTIQLINTVKKDTLVDGKIAPGTSGEFSIILDAEGSDVGVDYIVRFTNEKNKPTNIIFKYNNETYKSLNEIGDITGVIRTNENRLKEIKVEWEWPYRSGSTEQMKQMNDGIDTKEATTLSDYTFDLMAIGMQRQ